MSDESAGAAMILNDVKSRDEAGPHPIWLVLGPWAVFAVAVGGFLARWLP
ncbi:hypothetical protein [Methylobacterium terricola]|nr:hypothetical protein [Methylobacterium terricola]